MGQICSRPGPEETRRNLMYISCLRPTNDFLIENDASFNANTCRICKIQYLCPKILDCLHVFCEKCILKLVNVNPMINAIISIRCPICHETSTTQLRRGTLTLPQDYVTRDIVEVEMLRSHALLCESCGDDKEATHKCINCRKYLCFRCESVHKTHFTLGHYHYTVSLAEIIDRSKDKTAFHRTVLCDKHNNEPTVYYCNSCGILACTKCRGVPSSGGCLHKYEKLSNAYKKYETELEGVVRESKDVIEHIFTLPEILEKSLDTLQASHDEVESSIEETFLNYKALLEICKKEVLVELESTQKQQEEKIMDKFEEVKKINGNIDEVQKFASRLLENGSETEIMALKKLIFDRIRKLYGQIPNVDVNSRLTYNPEISGFQYNIRKYIGHIVPEQDMNSATITHRTNVLTDRVFVPSTMRPTDDSQISNSSLTSWRSLNVEDNPILSTTSPPNSSSDSFTSLDDATYSNNLLHARAEHKINFNNKRTKDMPQRSVSPLAFNRPGRDPVFAASLSSMDFPTTTFTPYVYGVPTHSNLYTKGRKTPPTRRRQRSKTTSMRIVARFGGIGSGLGLFKSPNAFCLSSTDDIVVADTLNHRIQVFKKDGTYKTVFGRKGVEEGQLYYPRKMVFLNYNQLVICDRGPEQSRLQIFEYPTGKFIKTIPISFRENVAGIARTDEGNVLLVVGFHSIYILSIHKDIGLIKWSSCPVVEPSDIILRNKNCYVCDYKGHTIYVFSEEGVFLRRIGGDYICFPNGIDIAENGDILVGDCYDNCFHVTIFSHEGVHLADLECPYAKVKSCGLKLTSDGLIVTLDKRTDNIFVFKPTH